MTLEIIASAVPSDDWDEFVVSAEGGTFCHLSGWHTIMEEVLGHEPLFLSARDHNGRLAGVLPLVGIRSRLFGRFLISMPFLNYGGPLGSAVARAALGQAAISAAQHRRADLLELRWRQRAAGVGPEALGAATPGAGFTGLDGFDLTGRKVTVLLPLPATLELLWERGLSAKVRNQVRRPQKEGLTTVFGHDQVEPFYEVFARNMRDLGTPVLPVEFFRRLVTVFSDHVVIASIYKDSTPIAAGFGFLFGDELEVTWASALREHNRAAPNMLLYWRLMEHALGRGAGVFNFGRGTPGGSTHRFKLQWGGRDEYLPWLAWSPNGRMAKPSPEQWKYAMATRVWQRLPVALTRALGPSIARSLP